MLAVVRFSRPSTTAIVGGTVMTAAMIGLAWVGTRDDAGSADLIGLGAEMLHAGLLSPGEEARYRLDGIPVRALAGRSGGGFEAVLAVASDVCTVAGAIDPHHLAQLATEATGEREPRGGEGIAVVVEEARGIVACLDVYATGGLRYLYAERAEEGTTFVVVWTERLVRLGDLTPDASGEVAGDDVPDLPRPPGALRRYSFVREDGRDQLVIYGTRGVQVERWAEEALPEAGWSVPTASGGERGGRVLASRRGGRRVHIVVRDDDTIVVLATTER
jgi:hypothetical protein